jgi:hypothetical protein
MGFEGQDSERQAIDASAVDDMLMAQMYAIEIADGGGRATVLGLCILVVAQNSHGTGLAGLMGKGKRGGAGFGKAGRGGLTSL